MTIVHILLAALGIGFLIFIHEFGHYIAALRQGMTVEVFSIGFGPPVVSWKHKNVRWQVCILPFGGYVKIAGMEGKGGVEPHQVEGGFYSKSAWSRIKVALAGPFVNIAFAFLIFCVIWALGGRERAFSQHTPTVGWVAPRSPFYEAGMRPGDLIEEINGKPFRSFEQLYTETVLNKQPWTIRGKHTHDPSVTSTPFEWTAHFLAPLATAERLKLIMQSIAPAQFLLSTTPPTESPMAASGLHARDRLIWANGHFLFSAQELHHALNARKVLLTILRDSKTRLAVLSTHKIGEYRLSEQQRGELEDFKYDAHVKTALANLSFIPYVVDAKGIVQERLQLSEGNSFSEDELKSGDRILAVDGHSVPSAQALLASLQTPHVTMIVKMHDEASAASSSQANALFQSEMESPALKAIIASIGTDHPIIERDGYRLLPSTPLLSFQEMAW